MCHEQARNASICTFGRIYNACACFGCCTRSARALYEAVLHATGWPSRSHRPLQASSPGQTAGTALPTVSKQHDIQPIGSSLVASSVHSHPCKRAWALLAPLHLLRLLNNCAGHTAPGECITQCYIHIAIKVQSPNTPHVADRVAPCHSMSWPRCKPGVIRAVGLWPRLRDTRSQSHTTALRLPNPHIRPTVTIARQSPLHIDALHSKAAAPQCLQLQQQHIN
jgi:hypothetical protein